MFTGIIKTVGQVRELGRSARDTRYVIETDLLRAGFFERGASIACNGVCLTLVEKGPDWFAVEVSGETLSKTTMGEWQKGTLINLESSLKMGDELGGHLVSGHVDGVADVLSITKDGGSHRVRLRAPAALASFIAPKGSVALDGISLTVNEVDGAEFGVNIIPYTWDHTNFHDLVAGGRMNIEIDILARYVRRMLEYKDGAPAGI